MFFFFGWGGVVWRGERIKERKARKEK
uniref:Uncharacterized protein n=1 Tax=Rhizophora mucronata TaxID=61149 RepID=A0A2P2NZP2_RHIMU